MRCKNVGQAFRPAAGLLPGVSFILSAALLSSTVLAQPRSLNPQVSKVVEGVSVDRIIEVLKKLESFETRNVFSPTDHPTRGTGAARKWILEQFQSYSPRLQVRLDPHHIEKKGRFFKDGEVVNIVAVLPGKTNPERHVLVSGHYDTINLSGAQQGDGGNDAAVIEGAEKRANLPAPGVTDDGSGIAATMELARVMSQFEWDNTLIFVAFDAEEFGLVGSRQYAERAKKEGQKIEAVLNNDIIGSEVDGLGRSDTRSVRLFSDGPDDSGSRQLARYIRDVAERYVSSMRIDPIFLRDRFARGGDHTSFHRNGFAAVRFTTPNEHYTHQHSATDTFANTSPTYIAEVTRVNGAVAASLALAPAAPNVNRTITTGARKGQQTPNISRGVTGQRYDARLRWSDSASPDLAGYIVVMRSTLAPFWEKELYVGNVTEFVLKGVSIDDRIFGVKAIDKDGIESLVSAYVMPETVTP